MRIAHSKLPFTYRTFGQSGNSSLICGTRHATWSTRRTPGTRDAPCLSGPRVVAPQVVWTLKTAAKVVSAETGPEISAPRDQTEQRHIEESEEFRRSPSLSSPFPLSLSSSALPSLLLPSPISGASQPTSTHAEPATPRISSENMFEKH
ncbi:hypothetical protein Q8A73_006927 [Channa argus]|nr:hypothetical protein Q8A73_006927 [Channa argus]